MGNMKVTVLTLTFFVAGSLLLAAQDSIGKDLKNAGSDTKKAAVTGTHDTKKGVKKATSATKHGVKKAAQKTTGTGSN